MVCVLDFIEDLLHVKQYKYESPNGSKYDLHKASAVDWFLRKLYQRVFMILIIRAGGLRLDLPSSDIYVIIANDWNPQLSMNLFSL